MLNNFFRINLPYGIVKNDNDEWMAFNREYMPLGYNSMDYKDSNETYSDMSIYTKYQRLTEKFLIDIAHSPEGIQRNEKDEINRIFLYNDGTNPVNQSTNQKDLWDNYFNKLRNFQS
ncbi:MAG: hypothetical protein M3Z26_11445 [Bacteroidota bacterium]|nr:hypothetical protein [Bacteroidota bacterium]